MNKELKKCFFCPRSITNQQKLVFVPEKGSNYHTCNLCWYKRQIIRNQKTIELLTKQNEGYQQKIIRLETKNYESN